MTKKRTLLSLVIFIIMILTLSGCGFGGAKESKNESKKNVEYTASDIKYVSDAGSEVAVVAGRSYTKTNNGTAAVALAYINGYTGPILVGSTVNSISYIFYYNGKNVVSQYGSVTIDGEEWYYSKNIGFMSGNYLSFKSKGSIYCSSKTTAEDVAKEIIPMLDKTKFSANKIMTVEDLKALNNSSDSYVLGADIDLSTEDNWQPIEGFTGVLNGGGYKITNLTINAINEENLGLFKTLEGTVKNLTIENASITARGNAGKVGIVAGTNKGTIKNVIVDGSINTPYYDNVGGLFGVSEYGIIEQCKNMAMVTGANNVGGIVGYILINNDDQLNNNENNGKIVGKDSIGGIAGMFGMASQRTNSNFTYHLENNKNYEVVNGVNNVGGIFGEMTGAKNYSGWNGYGYFDISLCENQANVVGTGDYVGGIVGYGVRVASISSCVNSADITGGKYVGGYVGYAIDASIKVADNNNTITGKANVGGIAGSCGIISNATNNGTIIGSSLIIDGVSKSFVGGLAGYCRGIIDSKNNSDIIVNNAGLYVGGLAGYVIINNSDQLNNNENNGKIVGKDSVGGIAGIVEMNSEHTNSNFTYHLENNKNYEVVNGVNNVGGIFGEMTGAKNYSGWNGYGYFDISLCENQANVVGTGDYVGGIVGYGVRVASISSCVNSADITGGNYVGGYVGSADGTNIKIVANNNTITGKAYVGGIAGKTGKIEDSTNDGAIISNGVIVENNSSNSYVGGIAGYATGAINCKNNTNITINTNGNYVGGIIGFANVSNNNEMNNNENYGIIIGTNYTGGIAGYISTQIRYTNNNFIVQMSNNKNFAKVNGQKYVGGITGYCFGATKISGWSGYGYIEMTYCVNKGEIKGTSNVGGIVGGYTRLKTDANIMDTNTTDYGDKLGS